ncbi:MAG: glycosyltransferase family 4 protein [Desulfobacteraceae bacterium]|nr:glycosyltransferase family 4 protein [Desulfobacteraceae bacterium]
MTKICHINLARGFRGGERQTELLVKEICKYEDIRQKVILRADCPLIDRLSGVDESLELKPISKPYILHAGDVKDCDLIHVHEAKAGQFAYLATRIYKKPYVITRRVLKPLKANPFTRNVYSGAERVIALSGAVKYVLVRYDSTLNPLVIPSMTSSLSSNQESRDKIKSRYKDKFLVGHAGALVNKDKGQQYIVEAAASMQHEYPQIHFLLLGQGRDEDRLKRMAAGLNNLEFAGFRANVGDYLGAFDLFLFPSLQEGLGSVLLDAMQFKLPIVATNVGGIPDIIEHGENGLLIPPADSGALADAVLYLYKNRDFCIRLAENAYKVSMKYKPSELARHYLQVYQSILAKKIGLTPV